MNEPLPEEENYLIGSQIARGGMGSVIMADDRKLERKVALKVMAFDGFSDESMRRRFVREAKILARLAHPNIVPIHDIVWEDGIPQFYTMKLVQGHTLQAILDGLRTSDSDLLRDSPLDVLLTIFLKVCDATAFAHSKGVLHRDLKPSNVMVGEFGEVLVMDWGLAGLKGDEPPVFQLAPGIHHPRTGGEVEGGEVSLTMDGVVMGTPRYMSPEQAQGRVEEIDELSDIFSLGGILYAILTLRPPVKGSSVREVLEQIAQGRLEPPTGSHPVSGDARGCAKSASFPHCPGGQVPKRLSAVTMKALAFERSQRYQSVPEFAADLVAFRAGFATSAEEIGVIGQLVLLMKRHKVLTASLAAILLLSVGFVLKLAATAEAERRTAESERRTSYSAILAQALNAREHHDLGSARRLLGDIDPDLRGFGWRLLAGLCRGDELNSFRLGEGRGAEPKCLAPLPDGIHIALISADGRLHIRAIEGAEAVPPRRLPALANNDLGTQRYRGLTFSPDGKRLAYANGDLVRVLDADTFAVLFEETSRLPQFGWLDNDRLLYGVNGSASPPPFPGPGAWILDFGRVGEAGPDIPRTPFPEMCAPLAIAPDRESFVLHRVDTAPWSWARSLHVYRTDGNLAEMPPAAYVMPGLDYPGKLALSQTGRFLALSAGTALNRSAHVVEVSSGRVIFEDDFRFPIHDLAIDPEERHLGLVGDDSVVRLYDITRGQPDASDANTYDDEVDPDRCQQVDAGGADAPPLDLITRSAQNGRARFYFGHEKRILDLAFHPGGALLTAGGDGMIRRWPVGTARPAVRLGYLETSYGLDCPAASPDGLRVLYNLEKVACICDVAASRTEAGNVTHLVASDHAPLAVLPNGRPVTLDHVSGDVVIWSREDRNRRELLRIAGEVTFSHNGQTGQGALSEDGKRLIGTLAGRLFSADLEYGTISWSGDLGRAASVFASRALSPDGEWIASTDFGPRVTIHRFSDPAEIITRLEGQTRDYDTTVAFSRDGNLLYVGNEDGRVRVWETATWREIPKLSWPAQLSAVTALAVSHDQTLVATSGDDTLKLFPAEPLPGESNRRERLSLQLKQSANWIQFARDESGRDRALLHSAPGCTLEIWETDGDGGPDSRPSAIATPTVMLRRHAAVHLPDGRVLVAGGESHLSRTPCAALSDCLLYDPASESWSGTGSMRTPRTDTHTLTLLPSGKVLVAGGRGKGGTPRDSCELYNPENGNWTDTGSMGNLHLRGALILLPNGRVLAAGGVDAAGTSTTLCELYDPATGVWSPTGAMSTPRSEMSWTLLPDGKALVVGGTAGSGGSSAPEIYDPVTESWQSTGSPPGDALNAASATTLPDGRVLLAGGFSANTNSPRCALFDSATGTWKATATLPEPRSGHIATLLRNGKVLITGGVVADSKSTVDTLTYDPDTEIWTSAPTLTHPRTFHTATLLQNGKILFVGGWSKDKLVEPPEVWNEEQ